MRIIKFRAWDKIENKMVHWEDDNFPDIRIMKLHLRYIFQQFTGLTDKNGKEIFEGDIVDFKYNRFYMRGEIKFVDNGFWMVKPNGEIHLPAEEYREVIGNIFETPELLK